MQTKLLLSTLFLFFITVHPSFAQKKMIGGLDFTIETIGGEFLPGAGATFESQLTRHSGFETGLFYRSYKVGIFLYGDYPTSHAFEVAERYISIPVLYKFYSSIINLSAGPTFDFFAGWKQTVGKSIYNITDYKTSSSFGLGGMLKLSKTINLTDKFLLEPELRYNHIFNSHRDYGGFGLAAKYRLN